MNLDKSKYNYLKNWGIRVLKQGEAHEAIRFVHFECEPRSFAGVVYTVARERDLKATVAVFSDRVVFAFFRPDSLMRPNMNAYPVVRKMRDSGV